MKWYRLTKTYPDGGRVSPTFVVIFFILLAVVVLYYYKVVKTPYNTGNSISTTLYQVKAPSVVFKEDASLFKSIVGKRIENVVELPSGHFIVTFSDFSNLILQQGAKDRVLFKQYFAPTRYDVPGVKVIR